MNEAILKQLQEENTFAETQSDDKTRVWISKTKKINYNELYKVMAEINLAIYRSK